MRDLKGIFSALLVAFNEDGSINEQGLRQIIRHNIDKMKVDGLYVGGSTGENFMLSTEEKKQTVKAALAALPEAASFVEVLLDAKRYALLDAVVRRVEELLDERLGILRAEVVSARALNETQQRQTEEALSARYGGEVKAIFKTNPALLGGLQIWCRGELIDGSLQGRLAKLQAELAQ